MPFVVVVCSFSLVPPPPGIVGLLLSLLLLLLLVEFVELRLVLENNFLPIGLGPVVVVVVLVLVAVWLVVRGATIFDVPFVEAVFDR